MIKIAKHDEKNGCILNTTIEKQWSDQYNLE